MQLEPGRRLGDYEIREPVGSGGMGEVYRARDTRLDRDVAIKVLPHEVADDASRRARFEREAKSVAALNHENIVTIHTIGEQDGVHYIAMELVEGEALGRRIPEKGLTTDELLKLAIPIAAALAAAHEKGIVHRDLKPANVMVTDKGKVKVLDFGLAKLARADDQSAEPVGEDSETATMTMQTRAGTVVGTMPYMSPEQLSGRMVGPASDLFSFGVMLYEMATGGRPFKGNTGPTLISSILTDMPQPVAELRPALPNALGELIDRCLAKDPDDRPDGAAMLGSELETLREGSTPSGIQARSVASRGSRRSLIVAAAVVLVVVAGASVWLGGRVKKQRWARNEVLPEIQRLSDSGDYDAAVRLAREAARYIGGDQHLEELERAITFSVMFETDPPGADVFVNSYRVYDRPWVNLGRAPVEAVIPIGELRFRASKPGYETFAGSGSPVGHMRISLVTEGEAPPGMVRIPAGGVKFGSPEPVAVDSFWLDRHEVTNAQFKEFVDAGGYRNREYWRRPILDDGRELSWDEAAKNFRDSTGRPGPSGWELGSYPDGSADHPVGGVSWYEAAAYAEWAGKSLPTVFHWNRGAAHGLFSGIIVASNFDGHGPAHVGSYHGIGPYGTYDMAGNVREWCRNHMRDERYILGGAWSEPDYMYGNSATARPLDRSLKNGFRCMRTDGELSADTTVAVDVARYDFNLAVPVDDDIYRILRGAYGYDRTDLDSVIEEVDDSSEHWRKETLTFRAAYGDERVRAYLFLPTNATPPFQTVVYFPSSAALEIRGSSDLRLIFTSFVIRSGRALIYPVYKGTYERRVEISGYNDLRDVVIQQTKDLQRSIDYLETRDDINIEKLAFFGLSLGAAYGPIFTAVEERFKASVLLAGGLSHYPPERPAESIPLNFAPRSMVPVLMINGRNDFKAPVETEIKPMFKLQGAPDEHKRLVLVDGGHVPDSPNDFIREALDWLDLYLGPVE